MGVPGNRENDYGRSVNTPIGTPANQSQVKKATVHLSRGCSRPAKLMLSANLSPHNIRSHPAHEPGTVPGQQSGVEAREVKYW